MALALLVHPERPPEVVDIYHAFSAKPKCAWLKDSQKEESDMKKLLSLLVAAVMVLSFSFATLAEDKPAAEK